MTGKAMSSQRWRGTRARLDQTLRVRHESPVDIATITVDRDSHVEVTFDDGKVCRFELEELRRAGPCAACRTARDQGEEAWLRGQPTGRAIADARLVGGYALGVTWSDGPSTGIYPFASLRRWWT